MAKKYNNKVDQNQVVNIKYAFYFTHPSGDFYGPKKTRHRHFDSYDKKCLSYS